MTLATKTIEIKKSEFEKLTDIINEEKDKSDEEVVSVSRKTSLNWFSIATRTKLTEYFVKEDSINTVVFKKT
jgi:hypothetical protein